MAEVIKGLGVRWAVQGITFTAGIVSTGTGTGKIQSIDLDRGANMKPIKGDNGETLGEVYYDKKRTLRISVIPTGTTLTGANAALDAFLPEAGTKITIVDANGTIIDDDYNLDSAKVRLSNEDVAMVDLEMHSHDANDITATIS